MFEMKKFPLDKTENIETTRSILVINGCIRYVYVFIYLFFAFSSVHHADQNAVRRQIQTVNRCRYKRFIIIVGRYPISSNLVRCAVPFSGSAFAVNKWKHFDCSVSPCSNYCTGHWTLSYRVYLNGTNCIHNVQFISNYLDNTIIIYFSNDHNNNTADQPTIIILLYTKLDTRHDRPAVHIINTYLVKIT